MSIEIIVRPGMDSAFIAWRAPFIPQCRGFALTRRIKRATNSAQSPHASGAPDAQGFTEEIVSSWVGFANGPAVEAGTRKPTTDWPIQKYLWSDFMVNPGDRVSYRVTPMVGAAVNLTPDQNLASKWSAPFDIGASAPGQISCFFNRGIVASQWLSRLLPQDHPDRKLRDVIAEPGNAIRNFLAGPVRDKLAALMNDANADKGHVYAALFELDDPELVPLLQKFRKRAHIVLGNGSVKHKGDDENAAARSDLAACDLKDRMTAPRALAHNKFLVICDADKVPRPSGPGAPTGPRLACARKPTTRSWCATGGLPKII
jgi:hypothetical protein